MANNGQAIIETVVSILLVLSIMLGTYKIFHVATENIVAEIQLIDLLKHGFIKRNNVFGVDNTEGRRQIWKNEIDVEVKIYDRKVSKRKKFVR